MQKRSNSNPCYYMLYNIKAATIPAPTTPAMFIELREAAPVNCGGLGVNAPVPFGGKLMLAKVVGVVIGTLTAGAVGVPWTRETTWLETPVMVSKTTCGTVTAVLMTFVVEEPGIVAP